MKTFILALSIFTALSAFAQDAAPAAPESTKGLKVTPAQPSKTVTVEEADKLIKETKGLIILDVRMPEEFEHEHIKGAQNVNVFDKDFEKLMGELDQTKPVLVHCAAGRRSTMALQQMVGKVKFPQIYHMTEGFSGWKAANKPFESKSLPRDKKIEPAPAK